MTLYEIDKAIEEAVNSSVDPETGEITGLEAIEALEMEREAKIENIALYHKNLIAFAADIKEEEKNLSERRKAIENKAERLKSYLDNSLNGEAFETAKCKLTYRKSTAVNISDEEACMWYLLSMDMEPCIKRRPPEINKAELTKVLKEGKEIPGAALEQRNNLSIK